jgi:hypothetical protein
MANGVDAGEVLDALASSQPETKQAELAFGRECERWKRRSDLVDQIRRREHDPGRTSVAAGFPRTLWDSG